jgi:hypothetical protein
VNLNAYCGGMGKGFGCCTRFIAHAATEACMLQFTVHLRFSGSAILSSAGNGRRGSRRTGRSGVLSEFWLPVKRSSVLLMFGGGGSRMMPVLTQ